MKFYHGTTESNWDKIQGEGLLWGVRQASDDGIYPPLKPGRCTYLTPTRKEAECYGDVVLKVDYTPNPGKDDNYVPDCWQLRVYVPILINKLKRVK